MMKTTHIKQYFILLALSFTMNIFAQDCTLECEPEKKMCDSKKINPSEISGINTSIAYIITRRGKNKIYNGTAFFIHPRVLITAGHNLRKRPYFFTPGVNQIDIKIGSTCSETNIKTINLNTIQDENIYTKTSFNKKGDPTEDYGVIILPKEYSNKRYDKNFILQEYESYCSSNMYINIAGYPSVLGFGTLWQDSTKNFILCNNLLRYDFYTAQGMSGAPIWINDNSNHVVIGLHTYGKNPKKERCNKATIFTKHIIEDIKRFCSSKGIKL